MLNHVDEQMDFRRWDGCPLVVIFRSLPYQDVWEKHHQTCTMINEHLIHLNERSRDFPVCN